MESWIIVKEIELENKRKQSILILDNAEEIWEFKDFESANRMAQIFEKNSDSGWKYYPRKVGSRQ